MAMKKAADVDSYIKDFPPETQKRLNSVRAMIKKAAPKAEEAIAYGMPGYKLNGKPLIYFAGFKAHIGLYALPAATKAFSKELKDYVFGKGSIQFPLDKPLPVMLIKRILLFRIKETKSAIKDSKQAL